MLNMKMETCSNIPEMLSKPNTGVRGTAYNRLDLTLK